MWFITSSLKKDLINLSNIGNFTICTKLLALYVLKLVIFWTSCDYLFHMHVFTYNYRSGHLHVDWHKSKNKFRDELLCGLQYV